MARILEGLIVTGWAAWKHALSHPADDVVAAAMVLLGAVITVTGTLFVSWLSRRAERLRSSRERLFEVRSRIFVETIKELNWSQGGTLATPEQKERQAERVQTLVAEVLLYSSKKAQSLWLEADKARKARDLAIKANVSPQQVEAAKNKSKKAVEAYYDAASSEVTR